MMNYLAAGQTGSGNMSFLIMMIVIFVIMYFFMIRPQNKQRKELQNFRNQIKVGDQVVTAGGIYGEVRTIDETNNILNVEISKGVLIRVDRNSVFQSAQHA